MEEKINSLLNRQLTHFLNLVPEQNIIIALYWAALLAKLSMNAKGYR